MPLERIDERHLNTQDRVQGSGCKDALYKCEAFKNPGAVRGARAVLREP